MKRKDIERCTHIGLGTDVCEIMETMRLELPVVKYFFRKDYGGRNKFEKYEESLIDKAMEEECSQVSGISEHISRKGNRWLSFEHVEYYPKARHAQVWTTSFVYYETLASCGAFLPMYRQSRKSGRMDELYGVIIYTPHFFQRMAERTGKAYRSKALIKEFITTMEGHASQADEDGDVIVRFRGGHGFGVKRSDTPMVLEVRTFLTDEQLTPAQRAKCKRVDAFAKLTSDGAFLKDVNIGTAYYSDSTPEEDAREIEERMSLMKTLGMEKWCRVMTEVQVLFLDAMCDLLCIEQTLTKAQCALITYETQDIFARLADKYEHSYDEERTSDAFCAEMTDAIVSAARKLKFKSMTKDRVAKWIDDNVKREKGGDVCHS